MPKEEDLSREPSRDVKLLHRSHWMATTIAKTFATAVRAGLECVVVTAAASAEVAVEQLATAKVPANVVAAADVLDESQPRVQQGES